VARHRVGARGQWKRPFEFPILNPILSENLCGLSRMLRSYASAALEDVALWHERDISHSSVERMIGPDATAIADFMVRRAVSLVRPVFQ
jgi:adenylosuccinate lyase